MTMKRILHCTLIFMVLVTSSCGLVSSSDSSSTQNIESPRSPRLENKINFKAAEENVRQAERKFKSPTSATAKQVKDEIDDAIRELGENKDEIRERCGDCTDPRKNGVVGVWQSLTAISDSLGKDLQKRIEDFEEEISKKWQEELNGRADELQALSTAESKPIATATVDASSAESDNKNDNANNAGWWSTLVLALKIVAGVLVFVLLVSAVNYLWNRSWKTLESNVGQLVKAHLTAARNGQPDYAPKLSSLVSTQADINSKLGELDTEVHSLARLLRESLARRPDRNPSFGGSNYQSYAEDVPPKDEPEFPVSAVDYLGKMNRFANVVRPDFQNGILVKDPEGTGELVVIQDPRLRDDTQPLFVIPRATQFHTKQDFYTYYQKYYDCARPSAGDVWIIGPAMVEKVAGGWQLREKGMLEVR